MIGLRNTSFACLLPGALAALALAAAGFAQQPPGSQSPSPPPQAETTAPAVAPPAGTTPSPSGFETGQDSPERILGVIPEYAVTNQPNVPPLTSSQKFRLFVRQSSDSYQWVAVGGEAEVSQLENTWPEYGRGMAGYGRRYATTLADVTDGNFMSIFLSPSLLKQDPRYFRLGRGTIRHRTLYSLAQEFWSKTDRGTRQFGYSNVLGAFAAQGISNFYYPRAERRLRYTLSRSGLDLLYGMGNGLALEFWPDIKCKLFRKCGGIAAKR